MRASWDVARKEKELNDRFEALYNQKESEEENKKEVVFDEEETVIEKKDPIRSTGLRALSESEEEWSDSDDDKENEKASKTEELKDDTSKDDVAKNPSSTNANLSIVSNSDAHSSNQLLSLGKDGKLHKAKPSSNLLDLFSRAKSKSSTKPLQSAELNKQNTKDEAAESQPKLAESTEPIEPSSPSVDENEYKEGEQPTEADYARYRRMMQEPSMSWICCLLIESVKNDLFDSEAEESGSEAEGGDSVDSETPMVVPEGIDITERPCITLLVLRV